MSADHDAMAEDLGQWWHNLTAEDILRTIPKAIEYSSRDLEMTGMVLQMFLQAESTGVVSDAELTCWFYLLSKVMRGIGAIVEGARPSEDTIRDIRVYDVMIQRIRESGGWPGDARDVVTASRLNQGVRDAATVLDTLRKTGGLS